MIFVTATCRESFRMFRAGRIPNILCRTSAGMKKSCSADKLSNDNFWFEQSARRCGMVILLPDRLLDFFRQILQVEWFLDESSASLVQNV